MKKKTSPRFASRRVLNWSASINRLRASATAFAGLSTLVFAAALVPRAEAVNDAWSTNPADNTFTGINWTVGATTPGAPTGTIASGASLYFGVSSTTALNENEAAGFSIANFVFNAGASAYTITGNSFALGAGGITNNGTNLETISDAFTLAAATTFTTTTGGGNLTLGGVISGGGSLTMAGTGTTTLSALNTFAGGTTVNSGTLLLGAGGGTGAVRGVVTVNTGGTLTLGVNNALGYNSGAQVTTLNVNGGTVNVNGSYGDEGFITSFNLTGGTMAYAAGGTNAFQISAGDATAPKVTSNASSTTSVISGGLQIRSGNLPIVVASGTTASGVDLLISGNLIGNLPFTKTGTGLLALTGTNAYSAATVSAGTLAGNTNGLVGNITNNSALVIDQTLGGTSLGSGTTAAIISGTGTLSKNNAGDAILSGASTYSGATNVNGGTLYVNGSLSTASAIAVASGAQLGGRGTAGTATIAAGGGVMGGQAGTGTLTLGGLTFSGNGTIFFGNLANYTTTPTLAAGTLTANGGANSVNLTVNGTIPGAGSYQLLSYSGTIGGAGLSALTLTALPNRATGALDLSQAGLIKLTVTGTDFLIWTGATTNTWDTTNQNWKLNSNGTPTTYIDNPGDTVVFDDTAGAAHTTVTLNSGNLHPTSVTFNNSALNYTLQGANGISGVTGLTKNGTGALALNTPNSYTGGTTLNAGTISLGNALALGTTGTITLGGGTLQYGASNNTDYSSRFSTAANQAYNIDTNGQAVTFATALTSAGGSLTKAGTGTLLLTANNTFTGATTVNGGTLEIGAGGGLYNTGTVAGSLNVNAGGTVRFSRNDSLGGSGVVSPVVVTVNGGTLSSNNSYTSLSSPFFNGATIIDNGGASNGFNTFRLSGTVTVGGTAPTNINVGTTNIYTGVNLGTLAGAATTTFSVADVTGDATSDFNVNVPVLNTNGNASGLTLTGPGTMSLNAANTYTGATTISSGTLQLGNGGTAGSLSPTSVITDNGNLTFRRSDSVTQGIQFSGAAISGTGSVTQAGTGSVVLNAANTYSGATAVNGGLLYVNGSLNAASAVSVAGGARLGGTGTVGAATIASGGNVEGGQNNAGTLTLSGLTFNGTGTAFFGNLANYTTTPAIAAGALTVNGGANSITLTVSGTVPGTGTYELLSYTGTVGGTGQSAFALSTLPNRATGSLDFSHPGLIDLNVTGSDFLIYSGGTTNTFDTTNPNFKLNSNGATTTYIDNPGDSVVFDDTAGAAHSTVTLSAGDVHPTSVTFNNSAINYTLQGNNAIAGTSGLTKTGTGMLTINNTNTYTGLTAINGGTLSLGSAGAVGTTGPISFGGGTLQYGANNATDYSSRFSTAANQAYSIDTNGQAVTFATGLTSAGGSLTKIGSGALTLTANNTFSGPTNVNAGTLIFSGAGALYNNGAAAGNLNVGPGATVQFNGNDALGGSGAISPVVVTVNGGTLAGNNTYTSLSNPVLNGATINSNGGTNAGFPGFSIRGTVTVGGTAPTTINAGATGNGFNNVTLGTFNGTSPGDSVTFNVADATSSDASDLTVTTGLVNQSTGAVGNSLIKTGAGTMMLTAASTYTGVTTVNAGSLIVSASGSLGSPTVTVNNTGTVLGGTGSITGAVTVNAGAILSAGNRASATPEIGMLSTGPLVFTLGSTFNVLVANGTAFSSLSAFGSTDISGAAFSVTLTNGATFAPGTILSQVIASDIGNTVFTNGSVTVGGYQFTADYTTDPGFFDLDVNAVPEPSSWAGFALAGLVGVSQRRKLKAWLCAARS